MPSLAPYLPTISSDTVIDVQMERRGPGHVVEVCVAVRAAGYEYEEVR